MESHSQDRYGDGETEKNRIFTRDSKRHKPNETDPVKCGRCEKGGNLPARGGLPVPFGNSDHCERTKNRNNEEGPLKGIA